MTARAPCTAIHSSKTSSTARPQAQSRCSTIRRRDRSRRNPRAARYPRPKHPAIDGSAISRAAGTPACTPRVTRAANAPKCDPGGGARRDTSPSATKPPAQRDIPEHGHPNSGRIPTCSRITRAVRAGVQAVLETTGTCDATLANPHRVRHATRKTPPPCRRAGHRLRDRRRRPGNAGWGGRSPLAFAGVPRGREAMNGAVRVSVEEY